MPTRNSRSNGHVAPLPRPIQPFPALDTETVVCVLSVGQAFKVQNAFTAFLQAQQQLQTVAQEFGFDINGQYRIEDDGRFVQILTPTADVVGAE